MRLRDAATRTVAFTGIQREQEDGVITVTPVDVTGRDLGSDPDAIRLARPTRPRTRAGASLWPEEGTRMSRNILAIFAVLALMAGCSASDELAVAVAPTAVTSTP